MPSYYSEQKTNDLRFVKRINGAGAVEVLQQKWLTLSDPMGRSFHEELVYGEQWRDVPVVTEAPVTEAPVTEVNKE